MFDLLLLSLTVLYRVLPSRYNILKLTFYFFTCVDYIVHTMQVEFSWEEKMSELKMKSNAHYKKNCFVETSSEQIVYVKII